MAYNETVASQILKKVFSKQAKPGLMMTFPLADQKDVLDTAQRLIYQGKIKAKLKEKVKTGDITIEFTK